MKRSKNDAEKRFSNDIELLLNGQEPGPFDQDADYVKTLQFAQRLMTLREEPHPDFQRKLKAGLLNRTELLEESAQSGHNPTFFERLFGSPALRLAAVSSFVVLVAVGLVWRAGLLSPMMTQPSDEAMPAMLEEDGVIAPFVDEGAAPPPSMSGDASAQAAGAPMKDGEYAVARDASTANALPVDVRVYVEPSYASGTTINVSVVFRNAGTETLSLEPFPPVVNIRQEGTSTVVRAFAAGSSQFELSPMEEMQYSLEWDQKDSSGTQVPAGRYELDVDTFKVLSREYEVTTQDSGIGVAAFEIAQSKGETQD